MRRTRQRRDPAHIAAPLFIIAVLASVWGWMGNEVMRKSESMGLSDARGTRIKGYLVNGKRLPTEGPNFQTYSRFGSSFGRTCVHEQVRDAMLQSYAAIAEDHPEYKFTYGETGWCDGGSFKPHKTHQNGLSVDFMVPVKRRGEIVDTPATILDGFGYLSEYDDTGKMGEFDIDFEAIAIHLEALRKAGLKNGLTIDRVILAPDLQDELFATKKGKRLKKRLKFSSKPVWVRHDDHYHVDFSVKKQRTSSDQRPKR